MARFLVDEDLPRGIVLRAASRGVDVLHVVDAGLRGRSDPQVLGAAVFQGRALVTADKEFGSVLVYPPEHHLGVVLVRIREAPAPDKRIERVVEALLALAQDDLQGTIVVVESSRIRIRREKGGSAG